MNMRNETSGKLPNLGNEMDSGSLEELARPVKLGGKRAINSEDMPYLSDFKSLERRRIGVLSLPWLALLLVGILITWAAYSEIEEVTRCQGKVISSKSVQVIQSLEGGIVDALHVEEGDLVEEGEPLLQMRDTIFSSRYQENLSRADMLEARLVRLAAVKSGFLPLEFTSDVPPNIAKIEMEHYEKSKYHFEVSRYSLQKQLELAKEQERILEKGEKAVPELEKIKIRRNIAEIEGSLHTLITSTTLKAMEDFDSTNAELEVLLEAIKADKDRLDRTVIKSPIRGTVNKIYINTAGRVVGSGDEIMEIVPADDTLLIEANVRPADIAFIAPAQSAKVKFTAYDYTVYGGLDGKVEKIGVDTITDDQGESFYQIKVRTPTNSLGTDSTGKDLIIIPGMITEVDILTGRRSILSYLLRPINRASERALRER